jgi:hypothetical protein
MLGFTSALFPRLSGYGRSTSMKLHKWADIKQANLRPKQRERVDPMLP